MRAWHPYAGVDGDELVFLDLHARRFVWLPTRCPEEDWGPGLGPSR